jgi:predicted Zn-dependent protease
VVAGFPAARAVFPEGGHASVSARALAALGRTEEGAARLREGMTLPPDPSETVGQLMENAAAELRAHGHAEAERAAVEKALTWYLTRPGPVSTSEPTRFGLARAHYAAGGWKEAFELFDGLHGAHGDKVEYLGYLGLVAARQGRLDHARALAGRLRDLDRPYQFGSQTLWRARILAVLGDRDALGLLREAIARGQGFGTWLHVDASFERLRADPEFHELLEPKG